MPVTSPLSPDYLHLATNSAVCITLSVLCLVTQSCPTLCDHMDRSPPGSSVHGDSPGKNTGVGCHTLLQGIFPSQGSNPGLPHCRPILCHRSHQGSPLPCLRYDNLLEQFTEFRKRLYFCLLLYCKGYKSGTAKCKWSKAEGIGGEGAEFSCLSLTHQRHQPRTSEFQCLRVFIEVSLNRRD